MPDTNVYERLWRQEAAIRRLVLDGYRDPEAVSAVFQSIIDDGTDAQCAATTGDAIELVVDYNRSLAEGMASGHYDYVNKDITEANFPIECAECRKGKEAIVLRVFHPDKEVESDEIIDQMQRENHRPISIRELLALGEAWPELQRQFPLVALGSIWRSPDGGRTVAGLWGTSRERRLTLSYFVRRWSRRHRFLAVRA